MSGASLKGTGPAGRLIYALNHPVRIQILEALARENASAKTLSEVLDVRLGNVCYHLCKVLFEECGVVALVEKHQRRGAIEKVFGLNREAYVGAIPWEAIPEPVRAGVRGRSLNGFLAAAVAALEAEAARPRADSLYAWRSVAVDAAGAREVREAMREATRKVHATEARCAALEQSRLTRLIVGAAAFEAAPLR